MESVEAKVDECVITCRVEDVSPRVNGQWKTTIDLGGPISITTDLEPAWCKDDLLYITIKKVTNDLPR